MHWLHFLNVGKLYSIYEEWCNYHEKSNTGIKVVSAIVFDDDVDNSHIMIDLLDICNVL